MKSSWIVNHVGVPFCTLFCVGVLTGYRSMAARAAQVEAAEPLGCARNEDFPAEVVLATIRRESVHRGLIDWSKAEAEFLARVAAAEDPDAKAGEVTRLFAEMGDVHSSLSFLGRRYSHFEGVDEETRRKVLPLLERERSQMNKPTARVLDGKFGYVLVPSMSASTTEEVEQLGSMLRDRVADVAGFNPKGWVIDLRIDGGGNLYPMLLGLAPLLGEGVVGGTVNAEGELVQEWVLKPDGLYWRDGNGDRRFAALDRPIEMTETTKPVVVLVGPITGSSGEATALAFRGRRRCTLMGEPTAKGYTTVINPFSITADLTLALAVGYMADRNGNACKSQVLPDSTMLGGDSFDSLQDDAKVQSALNWLRVEGSRP